MGETEGQRWLDVVRAEAAAVLGCAAEAIQPGRAFADLGFDSLTALELADRLTERTGFTLPGTAAFDYPTPAALAGYLASAIPANETTALPSDDATALPGGKATALPSGKATALSRDEPIALPTSQATESPSGEAIASPGGLTAGPAGQTTATAVSGGCEPIAIVGMACRYPGGISTPGEFWDLLAQGREGIGPFPTDRGWDPEVFHPDPANPGTTYVRQGGFLYDAGDFDPSFFGLSPREALATDPQQRLMLEISWEALERAGIDPQTLRGSRTGVFTGVIASDYAPGLGEIPAEVAGFLLAGNASSVVSGRVSYTFGLEGPALSVDTACSSSLVAVHLAATSLRAGECSLALAGGVTVIGTPLVFTEFARQGGLAPDGRCKSFAAGADGTGWAEGAGVLVLERLSDAQRLGHRVLAIIRGSAVNQDGASNGLTAPNGPSQQRLIAEALDHAVLKPSDVDAVEAHGTGTRLGDPIEAQALLATYGQGRDAPLWLGSVKSNLGHTQAASGVAGIIKMVLAMQNGLLPKTLHASEPSPFVDWEAGSLRLLTEAQQWPAGQRPRRAAVSSFGISGTNAHIVLEEAGSIGRADLVPKQNLPLLLSARTETALRQQAKRWAEYLGKHPKLRPEQIASAAAGRTAFAHRAVVLEHAGLDRLSSPAVVMGKAGEGKLALVFSGQGSQRAEMGLGLAQRFPVFAAVFGEVCTELDRHTDRPMRSLIADGKLLDQTGHTQPALFAVEVALFRLIQSWGVQPDYMLGHSIGELAAAHAAGMLSLPEACRLVVARGKLMQALPSGGAMVAIQATPEEVMPLLAEAGASLAAINAPRSVVVSGPEAAVLSLGGTFAAQGRKTTRLRVSHAFHSALMEPMLSEFAALEQEMAPQLPAIALVSNMTGRPVETLEPGYFTRHVRQPVLFADSIQWLAGQGVNRFLEIGPGGVLSALVPACLEDSNVDVLALPMLRDEKTEPESALEALARLHVHGASVDWHAVIGTGNDGQAELPTYPFQHKRFWLQKTAKPILGYAVELPGEGLAIPGQISLTAQPWLAEHVISDTVVVPGALFASLALQAADEAGCPEVSELLLQAPLMLTAQDGAQLRVMVGNLEQGHRTLAIYARHGTEPWTCHASGKLSTANPAAGVRLKVWPPPGAIPLDVDGFYPELAARGYHYGPLFQGLQRAWQRGDETFAEITLPAGEDSPGLPPALLDAALHAISLTGDTEGVLLPFSWTGMALHATRANALRVRITRRGEDISLALADPAGAPVASIRGLSLRPVTPGQLGVRSGGRYAVQWRPAEIAPLSESPGVSFADLPSDVDNAEDAVDQALWLVQQWLAGDRPADSRLAIVTQNAAGENPENLAQAAVWGLVRSAQSEHPGRFVLVDLDGSAASRDALAVAAQLDEPQIAIRNGQPLIPRLTRVTDDSTTARRLDPQGTVLITGGTGALGSLVAKHLVAHAGVRHLILAARRGQLSPELEQALLDLGAVSVRTAACDVSNRDSVAQLLAHIPASQPLTAVLHLAGVLDDGVIESQTPERIHAVLRPKAAAAWHLHELTKDLDLAAFVLFSSAAGLLGSPGQASYAAANAYLDALALLRHSQGLPAQALAWGLWDAAGGMAQTVSPAGLRRMRGIGLNLLTAQRGLELLESALQTGHATLVLAELNTSAQGTQQVPAVLRDLIKTPARRETAAAGPQLSQALPAMAHAEQERVLRELIVTEVASVLGHTSASELDLARSLPDLGFDSLTAVELRNRLAAATGLRLAATLVFDQPSVTALTGYLRSELMPQQASTVLTVMEELTRLEAGMAGLSLDNVARKRLAETLNRMMSKVDTGSKSGPATDDFHDLIG